MPSMQLLSLIFLFGYFLSIGKKFEMVAWQPSEVEGTNSVNGLPEQVSIFAN
jgi:hypothetical protein